VSTSISPLLVSSAAASPELGKPTREKSATDMRDAFIGRLYEIVADNPSIVMLSNDFGAPSLDRFRRDFPCQFINAAISEQNMASMAAGLALEGKKPILYSIATFITLRCLEQIKIDICAMKLPVTILAVGTGYAYSVDGPTHHATEDLSLMRAMAGMTVLSPSEPAVAAALASLVPDTEGPVYLRLDRGRMPILGIPEEAFLRRGFRVLQEGTSLALIATGGMVHRAIEVADALAQKGIEVKIIDLLRLKPLNLPALSQELGQVTAVVTLEEHTLHGGLGGLIAEALADEEILLPLKRCGIADSQLYDYGERQRLHQERGLDVGSLTIEIEQWLCKVLSRIRS
jgi:transketolase